MDETRCDHGQTLQEAYSVEWDVDEMVTALLKSASYGGGEKASYTLATYSWWRFKAFKADHELKQAQTRLVQVWHLAPRSVRKQLVVSQRRILRAQGITNGFCRVVVICV